MPDGGTLTIEAAPVAPDDPALVDAHLEPGAAWVRLTVHDTGQGMTEEVRRQVFEPFFTTKASGKGTGLGLSIVHGIVRQHGGQISVRTAPGRGTTFTILLRGADQADVPAAAPAPEAAGPGGQETILVAEDEEAVRRVVRSTLARAGYQVVEAVNGEEAIDQFSAHADQVGLCLLDLVMPRKNGREALEGIRALRPGVPVLLMSGYTGDVLAQRGGLGSANGLIEKPVTPAELLRRIREALDQRRSA
jgi:CheY-like chemotaxis protein